jgi:hypothetical protein
MTTFPDPLPYSRAVILLADGVATQVSPVASASAPVVAVPGAAPVSAAADLPAATTTACVIQRNDAEGFVSATDYASSFDTLASVSSDVDRETLISAMSDREFVALDRCENPKYRVEDRSER